MQGFISAKDAIILWNENSDLKITEVVVCEYGQEPKWKDFDNSMGANCMGWMKNDRETPKGLFLELITIHGFANDEAKIAALKEFTKMKNQSWANEFLRQLGIEDTSEAA